MIPDILLFLSVRSIALVDLCRHGKTPRLSEILHAHFFSCPGFSSGFTRISFSVLATLANWSLWSAYRAAQAGANHLIESRFGLNDRHLKRDPQPLEIPVISKRMAGGRSGRAVRRHLTGHPAICL